jgi:hypothetical protein
MYNVETKTIFLTNFVSFLNKYRNIISEGIKIRDTKKFIELVLIPLGISVMIKYEPAIFENKNEMTNGDEKNNNVLHIDLSMCFAYLFLVKNKK